MPLFKELTPEEDWVTQWQYNLCGDFHHALFEAICLADQNNLFKLELGFPDEVRGYKKYSRESGWWKEVQRKMGR